jgi:hypothetical protein
VFGTDNKNQMVCVCVCVRACVRVCGIVSNNIMHRVTIDFPRENKTYRLSKTLTMQSVSPSCTGAPGFFSHFSMRPVIGNSCAHMHECIHMRTDPRTYTSTHMQSTFVRMLRGQITSSIRVSKSTSKARHAVLGVDGHGGYQLVVVMQIGHVHLVVCAIPH